MGNSSANTQTFEVQESRLNSSNVTLSNVLIRASHSLTLLEKRCIASAIALVDSRKGNAIHAHLSEFQKIKITALDYSDTFGVHPKNAYSDLKKAADHLYERQLSIITKGREGAEKITRFRWVSSVSYVDQEGYIELSFSPEIYPHLNILKKDFTSYKLKNAASFRSIYSWRLFEIARSWLGYCQKKNSPVEITLDNLKSQLSTPDKYTWNDLKKRALNPAITEISERDNIKIDYKLIKRGRRVHALEFHFLEGKNFDNND